MNYHVIHMCIDIIPDILFILYYMPKGIVRGNAAGLAKSSRLLEFVSKYPNMMNGKGFKLLTDGVKVWMKKS